MGLILLLEFISHPSRFSAIPECAVGKKKIKVLLAMTWEGLAAITVGGKALDHGSRVASHSSASPAQGLCGKLSF